METITKMTDAELAQEYRALDSMIYVAECYGTSDMRRLFAVEEELKARGYDLELDGKRWIIERYTEEDELEQI